MTAQVNIRLGVTDAQLVERALKGLGAEGEKAFKRIQRASVPASKGLLAVDSAVGGMRDSMQGAVARTGPLGAGVAQLGKVGFVAAAGVGAAALATKALLSASRTAIDFVAALKDQADQAGTSVASLQALEFAAEQYGITQEKLVDGLKEASLRADEFFQTGKGSGADAFARLGIGADDLKGKLNDSAALFDLIIEKVDQLGVEGAARIRIFDEIFGGSAGEEFVRLAEAGSLKLQQLKAEARELGLVLDDHLVARADEASDKLKTLERIADINLKSALVDLYPILITTAELFADIARFVADVVDGFRDLENRSTRNLEAQLVTVQANIARLEERRGQTSRRGGRGGSTEIDRELRAERAELERIKAELDARANAPLELPPVTAFGNRTDPNAGSKNRDADVLRDLERSLKELNGGEAEKAEVFVARFTDRLSDMASPEMRANVADLAQQLFTAKDAMAAARKAQADFNREQSRAQTIIEGLLTPQEQLVERQADLKQLFEAGHFGEGARGLELYTRAVEEANSELSAMGPVLDTLERGTSQVFSSMISGATSAREALGQLLQQMAQAIAQPVFDQAGSFFSSSVSGLFAADGAAFAAGGRHVTAFAKGGVIGRPTLFDYAGGLGLMGEAGPEAIMPLTKMRGGQLGVRAEGGSSTANVFIDARGADPGVEERLAAVMDQKLAAAAPTIIRGAVTQVSTESRRARLAGVG